MGRPRKPINEILLSGNPGNKSQAEIAERIAEERADFEEIESDELAELNRLIVQTMVSCRRGQTVNGEPNPAFKHLGILVRARELARRSATRSAAPTALDREIEEIRKELAN